MTETQKGLFKLLCEIDDICKKYDITYYLECGTMLGAVRHEGFIPWDADIDISMTEENYNRFKEACEKELDHKTRTFCDNRMNREFPTVYGHYIDLECCRMSGHTNFWDYYCGQSIDVFCLLELPTDMDERRDFINYYYAYDEYVNESFAHYRRKPEEILRYYRQFQEREKQIGKEATLKEIEERIWGHRYPDTDTYMAASARGLDPTPFVPKAAYGNGHRIVFEDREVTIAEDYGELLILYYGDDYNLFPANPKKYTDMTHTGVPCHAYVDDFMSAVNKTELLSTRKQFKELEVQEGAMMNEIQNDFYKATSILIRHRLERAIRKNKMDVRKIIESGDNAQLQKLNKLYDEYFNKQLNPSALYWRAHYDIGDELEYAAMYLLMSVRDKRRWIDRLIWLREQNNLPLTQDMKELKNTIRHLRDIKKFLLYKDYEKVKKNLDWGLERFPNSEELRRYQIQYKSEVAQTEEEFTECLAIASEKLEKEPGNIYYKKAMGDIYWKQGRKDEALVIYEELKQISNDGLMLLDIKKKVEE